VSAANCPPLLSSRSARIVALCLVLLGGRAASAEVVRVEIQTRVDDGRYERLIGRVYFVVDPTLPANRAIADIALAPRNADGLVEFSSDVLFVRPKDARRARGTVFLEIVNRGRDQSLGLMTGARPSGASPEEWDLGDRFMLEQGFTAAFLGWQFDVPPGQGLGLQAPVAPVRGLVRVSAIESGESRTDRAFGLSYCAPDAGQKDARLTFRTRIDGPVTIVPRDAWRFGPGGCSVEVNAGLQRGLYEAVYDASGSPVAGLGLAAVRDFASYLKHGAAAAPLRETPAALQRVLGFGYSQSGRFLREFVRDGFNVDERGRAVFDAMMISSAGAGGGSFNHRFAMPGQAGNSVLSILRPVDLPPFTDDGLLANARAAGAVPKIFYTFSSTEYWARAGSLTHTSDDGRRDVPLADTSRLYFLTGTPHAGGPPPPARVPSLAYAPNFAEQRWTLRALLVALDAWIRSGAEPPSSRYPAIARGELVARDSVRFPAIVALPFAPYLPHVWRMDYGPDYAGTRVITKEPPELGAPFPLLVPQVDADGNELGGIRLPEVAVPLGTFTGWNVSVPPLADLEYLAGLQGAFQAFARTRGDRRRSGDPRPSLEERYPSRQDYLDRVESAAHDLVRQRFLLGTDVAAVVRRAEVLWATIAGPGPG
jgi:hypothetical protein